MSALNLPNLLTLGRIAGIPVLMAVLIAGFPRHDEVAGVLFLILSLTDTLDGQLARRRREVSELGKFLDPLADKLLILAVLLGLVQAAVISVWIVIIIFSRELLITILRSVSAAQGHVIAATPFGKTKTVTQTAAVTLLILERPYPVLTIPATLVLAVAVGFTIVSGLDYLWRFRHVFTRAAVAVPAASPAGGAPGAESPVHPLARRLGERLTEARLTLALAESCTGGLIAAHVTDQPGSSAYFLGGIVSYSDASKREMLAVPADLLKGKGAVSSEVAKAMAEGARRRLGSDLGAAVTGIAGPEADGTEKPVGLTYVAVAGSGGTKVTEFNFQGDRWENRRQAALEALKLILDEVEEA
jgi:CDP-diacylglycerol--glycerol-3-phosphate 3-phosphatidyltransferase